MSPVWSPDGSDRVLEQSRPDPDRNPAAQMYVAEAKPGAAEKQLTENNDARGARPLGMESRMENGSRFWWRREEIQRLWDGAAGDGGSADGALRRRW